MHNDSAVADPNISTDYNLTVRVTSAKSHRHADSFKVVIAAYKCGSSRHYGKVANLQTRPYEYVLPKEDVPP